MLSPFNIFKNKYQVSKEILSFEQEELLLRSLSKNNRQLAENLFSLAKATFLKYPLDSIRIMTESHKLKPKDSKLKWVAFRLYDYGKLEDSYNLLRPLPQSKLVSNSERKKYKKIISEYQYIEFIKTFLPQNTEYKSEKTNICANEVQFDKNIKYDFWNTYKEYSNFTVAVVSDENFYKLLDSVVNCVYITPANYKQVLSEKVDLLLITPTELGVDECWDQLSEIGNNEQKQLLVNIVSEFNNLGVKTVYYSNDKKDNDEDLCLIKECKYVLFTNKNLSAKYSKDYDSKILKHTNTDYLGINPLIFNPKNIVYRNNYDVFYSGIWFVNNPHKCQTLNKLFHGVVLSNRKLSIVNNIEGFSIEKQYQYPIEFKDYILSKEHCNEKRGQFGWILNYSKSTNQYCIDQFVKDLVNGYLVISDYSYNIHETLPYVFIVRNCSDVARILCNNSSDDMYERRIFSTRFIIRNFNILDNLNRVFENIELPNNLPSREFSVLVIGNSNKFSEECFKNQSYGNKHFTDESLVTEELISKFNFVTWFSDDNLYEEFYLEDMVNGFKYSNSDFIVKSSNFIREGFVGAPQFCQVDRVTDKYKTLFRVESFKNILLEESWNNSVIHKGFSIDYLNFVENYYQDNIQDNKSQQKKQYKLSVIIPVYNNGDYLYAKAFASIKMQTKFNEIEIVIVDDGSTDNVSVSTIKYLERHYANVRGVFLEKGGSGSASYPRNEGLKVCSGQFITFLDPDDECLDDSYSNIISLIEKENPNIIIGNNVFSAESETISDNYSLLKEVYGERQLSKDRCFNVSDIDFKAIRIQSMVINRAFLRDKKISFIEHAIGEDSLFSWQILHMSNLVMFTDICMHVYYSRRINSESNLICRESLEKLSLIQPHKIKWLVENNLIETYMDKKFEKYVQIKLLRFLNENSCHTEQEQQIQEQLQKILRLYKPYYLGNDEAILRFM